MAGDQTPADVAVPAAVVLAVQLAVATLRGSPHVPGLARRRPGRLGRVRTSSAGVRGSRLFSLVDLAAIRSGEKSKGRPRGAALTKVMSGDVLLSHDLPVAVPSALKGLTSGFGMEPGISPSLWPPKLYGVMNQPSRSLARAKSRFPTVTREPHSGRATSLRDKPSAY